jgi:D-alanyl-D-alanine carboxypeptidase
MLGLLIGLLLAAGTVFVVDQGFFSDASQPSRPELQQVLNGLVSNGDAPGVTAYVTGPQGTWIGSAGVANIATGAPMRPDMRMRIESNSKTWVTAVILQLAQEGTLTLDDTVERWLPGLLRAHGSKITIRQLMYDASGLIDDNDVWEATPTEIRAYLARVGDAKLRRQLVAAGARLRANPAAELSPLLFIRLAAWQPLVAPPGSTYHHSNIGWNIVGLIAAEAGGKTLPALYRERLFEPLGLEHTAFDPQGPIAGQHANGYEQGPDGTLSDRTAVHPGKSADGAIVTRAEDEGTFLRALMTGKLFDERQWLELYGAPGDVTGCGGKVYAGIGAGNAYRSVVLYDSTGSRIVVLLLNKDVGDAVPAARRLYCAA